MRYNYLGDAANQEGVFNICDLFIAGRIATVSVHHMSTNTLHYDQPYRREKLAPVFCDIQMSGLCDLKKYGECSKKYISVCLSACLHFLGS